MIDLGHFIERLEQNAASIENLATRIDEKMEKWRPSPEKWSITEIIHHLYDEERDDFRKRLKLCLFSPGTAWPPIDPEGWVKERKYNERNLGEMLVLFLKERAESLRWLESLDAPDWGAPYLHPQLGKMSAGDLLHSWLAHDYFHIRQLTNLHLAYLNVSARPYSTAYASS